MAKRWDANWKPGDMIRSTKTDDVLLVVRNLTNIGSLVISLKDKNTLASVFVLLERDAIDFVMDKEPEDWSQV